MDDEVRTAHEVGDPPRACELCGRGAEEAADVLTWTLDVHEDGQWEWICAECSREHLPAIEARLHLGEP